MILRLSASMFFLLAVVASNAMEQIIVLGDETTSLNFNKLVRAVREKNCQKVIELLKDKAIHARINTCDRHGQTLLHAAVSSGLPDIVSVLLMAGADITHRDYESFTPFDLAISSGNLEVLDLFMEHHPSPFLLITQKHPETELTPLRAAIYSGSNNLPLIRTLVEHYSAPITPEDIHTVEQLIRALVETHSAKKSISALESASDNSVRLLNYRAILSYLRQQRFNQRSSSVSNFQPHGQVVVSHSHQRINQVGRNNQTTQSGPIQRRSRLGSFIKLLGFGAGNSAK